MADVHTACVPCNLANVRCDHCHQACATKYSLARIVGTSRIFGAPSTEVRHAVAVAAMALADMIPDGGERTIAVARTYIQARGHLHANHVPYVY